MSKMAHIKLWETQIGHEIDRSDSLTLSWRELREVLEKL